MRGTLNSGDAVTRAKLAQPRAAGVTRGELRAEVALAFFGSANIVEQQRENVAVESSAAHDLHRRNAKSFLINLATRAHRTSVGSADIGVMRASGDEEFGEWRCAWRVASCAGRFARKRERRR